MGLLLDDHTDKVAWWTKALQKEATFGENDIEHESGFVTWNELTICG
jgi:hypothetical protein